MELIARNSSLWHFLNDKLQHLVEDGEKLLGLIKESQIMFYDYSVVVFPFAKAYEGFLKDLFLSSNLITPEEYASRRFRIGRALNPELDRRFRRRDSIYDRLTNYCGHSNLANELWEVWKKGRNGTFHYFPRSEQFLNLEAAQKIILEMLAVMAKSLGECRVKITNSLRNTNR